MNNNLKKFRICGTFSMEFNNQNTFTQYKASDFDDTIVRAKNETDALMYVLEQYIKYSNREWVYFLESYTIEEIT